MSSFIQDLQYCWDSYYKFIKEQNKRESMTPKEYGLYISKKRGRKKRRAGAG